MKEIYMAVVHPIIVFVDKLKIWIEAPALAISSLGTEASFISASV